MHRRLYVVGGIGSGKSTISKLLAHKLKALRYPEFGLNKKDHNEALGAILRNYEGVEPVTTMNLQHELFIRSCSRETAFKKLPYIRDYVVFDNHPLAVIAFTSFYSLNGSIAVPNALETNRKMWAVLEKAENPKDTFILLRTPVKDQMKNIRKRARANEPEAFDKHDLMMLNALIESFLMASNLSADIMIVENQGTPEESADGIIRLLEQEPPTFCFDED